MKTGIFVILALCFNSLAWSQKRAVCSGYGNFEGFNISMRHQPKKTIYMYGLGNDLNIFNQGYYNCGFVSIGRPFLTKRIHTSHMLSLHFRVLAWNIENESNIFSAVSFSPQLRYTRNLSTRFSLSAYAGYVYSSVFRYKRKGYYEVGWPREWLPDFGVSLQYCLTCKSN